MFDILRDTIGEKMTDELARRRDEFGDCGVLRRGRWFVQQESPIALTARLYTLACRHDLQTNARCYAVLLRLFNGIVMKHHSEAPANDVSSTHAHF